MLAAFLMAQIHFITPEGNKVTVTEVDGTVMEAALDHHVEGIEGACGGVCSCATCHVKVAPEWLEKVGRATELEMEMLEMEDGVDERSRLSCQIELKPELDGLTVEVYPLS